VPEVESAIIKFKIAVRPAGSKSLQLKADSPEKDEKKLFHLAKIGFSSKRKMLKNNLSAGLRLPLPEVLSKLKQVNFSEKIRAQELSLADWIKLSGLF
jgi:16S rRNA (adenine1518-N6/adenine1519-N6)-dimethyltransferase